jgi:hypothetical protein
MRSRYCHPHQTHIFAAIGLFLLLLLGERTAVFSQEPPPDLIEITHIDDAAFPLVKVNLFTINQQGGAVDLSGASLRENGIPVAYETAFTDIGLDAIFVIDANETLFTDDNGDGNTRADQVNASINQFASTILRPELDAVSVIVPDEIGANGRFLIQESNNPQTISEALASYTPLGAWPTPLQDMLRQAIAQAVLSKENGRYPTILLFTDGGRIHLQLDYEQLLQPAQTNNLPISAAILGAEATEDELFRTNRLSQPTRGTTIHMRDSSAISPLFAQWQQQGQQPQLHYESLQTKSGQYPVALNLNQQRVTSELNLELRPPEISILPPDTEITRRGSAYDTPVSDLEPKQFIIPVQINWPDEKPRALTAVVWQVNGQRQPQMNTLTPNADSQLMLSWDLELLDEGSYTFVVDAVDVLGFTATSDPITINIITERPLSPTTTPLPTATPEPEPITPESMNLSLWLPLLGLLGLTGLVLLFLRNRRQITPPLPDEDIEPTTLPPLPEETDSSPSSLYAAYLDPINQPDTKPILLSTGSNIIGRDETTADIFLEDNSVSRLHARIAHQNDNYWLYDEGSAQGTYLNYTRLGLAPKAITDQDLISIGRLQFRFSLRIPPDVIDDHAVDETEEE